VESVSIELDVRSETGSRVSSRLRKQGLVPAVVYSKSKGSFNCSMVEKDFVKVARTAKRSQLFQIKCKDKGLNGSLALIKEVQKDFLKQTALHVDFMAVSETDEVRVDIGLVFDGTAPGVKVGGGLLSIATYELSVLCLPREIPQSIIIDISKLEIGDTIHAGDIKLPKGVKLGVRPEEAIVGVVVSKDIAEATASAAPAVADAAAAPVEGAPAAEGAAAPASDAKAEGKEAPKKEAGKKE
jgi:large subunit ribosomal protein L25